jgi:protein-S-isoprenylcysteine O-methyltransferase Ste14
MVKEIHADIITAGMQSMGIGAGRVQRRLPSTKLAYNLFVVLLEGVMDSDRSTSAHTQKVDAKQWLRGVLSLAIILGTIAVLLFGSAGRLNWLAAWCLILGYGVYLVIYMLWGFRRNPDLVRERGQVSENVKVWDKWINAIYTLLVVALLIISGLDAGRYGWSSVSSAMQIMGGLMVVLAGWLIFRTIVENDYLSRWARIQDDRGQQVISTGPYAVVRHPMYAGIILLMLGMPMALGSLWGLVPGALIGCLFLLRTSLEDRMLHQELDGYTAYASRVRYRLLPWIW